MHYHALNGITAPITTKRLPASIWNTVAMATNYIQDEVEIIVFEPSSSADQTEKDIISAIQSLIIPATASQNLPDGQVLHFARLLLLGIVLHLSRIPLGTGAYRSTKITPASYVRDVTKALAASTKIDA